MRIGIVNDLSGIAELLRRAVIADPAHRVIWVALNGAEAVTLCARETPDLILMDLMMPVMDGAETTRRIMASTPCAILIVTGSVRANANRIFEAMGYGALDAVDTPLSGLGEVADIVGPLMAKIATISRLVGDPRMKRAAASEDGAASRQPHDRLIAIGASAGGPAVLATILRDLPGDLPAAVVIVQHVDRQFAGGMATWLNDVTALRVRVAEEGDRPAVGEVLLAATGDHLMLKSADRMGYTGEPADYAYRPSVDVFFHSACRMWRGDIVGVLLTGMGRDGALGLKALRDRGHYTIAQDEATSAVYGMPKAAATINAAVAVLPADRIAARLVQILAAGADRPPASG